MHTYMCTAFGSALSHCFYWYLIGSCSTTSSSHSYLLYTLFRRRFLAVSAENVC